MIAPKPEPRAEKVSLWRYFRLFRQDILSAQPERLYTAKMAVFKTPFFRSFMINEPDLIAEVLKARPDDFPKSERIGEGLRPLLGKSVFLTNGETWKAQRRIIDPAFEGGRIKAAYPAMFEAAERAVVALQGKSKIDIERHASQAAADVIFRTLFSMPIEDRVASEVYAAFQAHQRAQPILNLAAFVPLPAWMPRPRRKEVRQTAQIIRRLIAQLCDERAAEIKANRAPADLATKIMTTPDPQTGRCFETQEMIDQVAIFFLAGHETSASALAWSLYLLAASPDWQDEVASEVSGVDLSDFSELSKLKLTHNVFREALRLYPPVPMMVRAAQQTEHFRKCDIKPGDQIVISPWHLHRNGRYWDTPDHFDPSRWDVTSRCPREAYKPFSSGPRVCPGAGFAMVEGPLLLARLVQSYRFEPCNTPVPVAHLTVRSRDGIALKVSARDR
ncbi:MAG: cytochrome P450 [Pseudomonadota bacterium]